MVTHNSVPVRNEPRNTPICSHSLEKRLIGQEQSEFVAVHLGSGSERDFVVPLHSARRCVIGFRIDPPAEKDIHDDDRAIINSQFIEQFGVQGAVPHFPAVLMEGTIRFGVHHDERDRVGNASGSEDPQRIVTIVNQRSAPVRLPESKSNEHGDGSTDG